MFLAPFVLVYLLAMAQREHQDGVSGKIILFIVLGVFPAIFMLIVLLFGPMLGLRFGA